MNKTRLNTSHPPFGVEFGPLSVQTASRCSLLMNPFAQALSAALGRCIASKEISEHGRRIGFLYRETPVFEQDSGWRFFAGDESDEYAADPDNFAVCSMADISERHPDIQPLLQEAEGAWEWSEAENGFVPAPDWQPQSSRP